ncbi:DNA-binding protein P3A2-like [Watersipora subatra]|uniref:DNA-binding protein P3A2-like n=1 Tax=Watersipora subatra TaxID=2589382 RepID=UPI00355AF215
MQADSEMLVSAPHVEGGVYKVGDMNDSMMHDDPMSDDSNDTYDTDLIHSHHVHPDGVHTRNLSDQLCHSGPAGVAAAAAIASFKKKRKPHSFETNPAIRKRQQTRLLRKIRNCIEEYTIRVGQQAAFLAVTPSKGRDSNHSYKVFGSQPLENVLKTCRNVIVQDLEQVLAAQAPPPAENSHLFELPPLLMDGMPTPLEKMTQAHLRAFIPEMLKYSTGRSKPGWGKLECQPLWWPVDVPWANIRCDVRTEEDKKTLGWTQALRSIIRNCYKHHGREDLLPAFEEDPPPPPFVMQTINNPDGSLSIIQIDTSCSQLAEGSEIITLADGTQATVVRTLQTEDLDDVGSDDNLNTRLTEATLTSEGAIMIPDGGGDMVQLPVSVYNGTLMVSHLDNDTTAMPSFAQNKSEVGVPPSTQTVEIS